MKKLLIIMTLFMSSFFLFCHKEVKASSYTFNLDFTLLNEKFNNVKNAVENYILTDTTYSDNYIIFYYKNDYYVHLLPLGEENSSYFYYGIGLKLYISSSTPGRPFFSSDYTKIVNIISGSSDYNYVYREMIPLYANYDIIMTSDTANSTITYNYEDFTSINIANGTDKFKTLYMLYQEYNGLGEEEENPHKEELEKVGSFYNIVIEKLSYLGEVLVSNYIYLSIIVIFILIFVFLLIFRRFIC